MEFASAGNYSPESSQGVPQGGGALPHAAVAWGARRRYYLSCPDFFLGVSACAPKSCASLLSFSTFSVSGVARVTKLEMTFTIKSKLAVCPWRLTSLRPLRELFCL